jgi:hypothetical protein
VDTGEYQLSTNDREGGRYRNYDAASGTILRICKGFHRSKLNLSIYSIILFAQAAKKFKN